jgi:hypothetical protein
LGCPRRPDYRVYDNEKKVVNEKEKRSLIGLLLTLLLNLFSRK